MENCSSSESEGRTITLETVLPDENFYISCIEFIEETIEEKEGFAKKYIKCDTERFELFQEIDEWKALEKRMYNEFSNFSDTPLNTYWGENDPLTDLVPSYSYSPQKEDIQGEDEVRPCKRNQYK